MRDAVVAVDEAVRVVTLAMLLQCKIEVCIRRPLRLGGRESASSAERTGRGGEKRIDCVPCHCVCGEERLFGLKRRREVVMVGRFEKSSGVASAVMTKH